MEGGHSMSGLTIFVVGLLLSIVLLVGLAIGIMLINGTFGKKQNGRHDKFDDFGE